MGLSKIYFIRTFQNFKLMKHLVFALLFLTSLQVSCQVHLGPGQSFLNIQAAANAQAIQPGDTVYLHAGNYFGYQFVTQLKGKANDWIVIRPYKQDAIEIAGTWQFVSAEYLRFEHLTFKGNANYPGRLFSVDNGGSCLTQSKFIVVDSCHFSNVTDPTAIAGFKFGGVDSFAVTHCVFQDFPAVSTMDYNVCHVGLIQDNLFENCLSGGHIKGGASDIRMERNLFINASKEPWVAFELGGNTGAQFYCPSDKFEVKNLEFYSNVIIGGYRGLALSSARDCKVINNTFYQCGQATMRFLTTSALYPTLSGNILENNLFVFGNSAYFNGGQQPSTAASFSNNLYQSTVLSNFNGPYWDSPALDAIKDPNPLLFGSSVNILTDALNGDYNIIGGCPAEGAGKLVTEPSLDFYGLPFSATARSIGAAEVVKPLGSDTFSPIDPILVFPNPATDYLDIPIQGDVSEVQIYNSMGIRVRQSKTGQKINISDLPAGMYFLRIGKHIQKFQKN